MYRDVYLLLAILFSNSYSQHLSAQGILSEPLSVNSIGGSQSRLGNIPGRKTISLNGKWQTIIDQTDIGNGWLAIWKDQKAKGKSDFYEYSFDGGNLLDVPGDFNSQLPEMNFFEGTVLV